MNESSTESLAIIVAMTDPATPSFADRLARFAEEAGPLGEVFVIDSSGVLNALWLARRFPNVKVLFRPIGQLAPVLWRDGLVRTEMPLIAFTTSDMRLSPGWRIALIDRLRESGAAGVGGPIEPGPKLSNLDRAVTLLRYSNYFSPLPTRKPPEPPGDNALYRRDRLEAVEHSWVDGFWEVEVHQALREHGDFLTMAGTAIATYEGGAGWRSMIRQRLRHAKRYGMFRSRRSGFLKRFLRIAVSPLVPIWLCLRALRHLQSRRRRLIPWISASPGLMVLASAWTIGEVVGTWLGSPIGTDPPRSGRVNP